MHSTSDFVIPVLDIGALLWFVVGWIGYVI